MTAENRCGAGHDYTPGNRCPQCHRDANRTWYRNNRKSSTVEFGRAIRELAAEHGVTCSPPNTAGFPLIAIGSAILYRCLKTGTAMPGPTERAYARSLLAAGQDWALWRDDEMELVNEDLRRIAGPTPEGPDH